MKIILSDLSKKQLKKLDKAVSKKIVSYLYELEKLENPRTKGKPLVSNLKGLWCYRVNDYRIICKIIDDKLTILALKIGHRKDVYKSN